MEKTKLEQLIELGNYFRSALTEEISLPESKVSMSTLVKIDGIKMTKLSQQATRYRATLDKIENELFKLADALVTADNYKLDKDLPVVTAETDLTEKKGKKRVQDFMPVKETDKNRTIYGSLSALPDEGSNALTTAQKDEIVQEWKKAKGSEAKAKLFAKVRDILNNQSLPPAVIREDLAKFAQKVKREQRTENEMAFVNSLQKEGITFDTNVDLKDLVNGQTLLAGKTQYEVDGEFNILLLTGKDSVDDVDPQDYVKLRAIWLRTVGRERQAIDELTKFYSDAKKGIIWTAEQATLFLNGLFKVNGFKHIYQLVENILIYKEETKGSYKAGINQAKNLLRAFTRYTIEKDGKSVKQKIWPDRKINNLVNRILVKLADEGKIKGDFKENKELQEKLKEVKAKNKVVFTVKFGKDEKGKYNGKIEGGSLSTDIVNYKDLESFKKACNTIVEASIKDKEYEIKYSELVASTDGKEEKVKDKPKGTFRTKEVPAKDKVHANKNGADKDKAQEALVTIESKAKDGKSVSIYSYTEKTLKEAVSNVVKKDFKNNWKGVTIKYHKTQNKPVTATNSAEKYKKTKEEKEALKKAKKAAKANSQTPKAKVVEKPQYSAKIVKEEDGTYSCTLQGFNEVVKTTGSKSMEEAQEDFHAAIVEYSERIKRENDKARASHKKGKMLHLKPDFSKGELTFLSSEEPTGTNG